jgi:hypothetical protein
MINLTKIISVWLLVTAIITGAVMAVVSFNVPWFVVAGVVFVGHIPVNYLIALFNEKTKSIEASVEKDWIEAIKKRLSVLEYRPYIIYLDCAACKKSSPVEVNLDDTEYDCPHCNTTNAIYTSFSTAQVTKPVVMHGNEAQ